MHESAGDPTQVADKDTGTGTLVLVRSKGGYRDRLRSYIVLIDGAVAGRVRRGGTLRIPLCEGEHTLQLKVAWCESLAWGFTLGHGGTAAFGCAPGGEPEGLDDLTIGRHQYIKLQPVADPAQVAAVQTSPGTWLLVSLGYVFFIAGFATIGGLIWHRLDESSSAAATLASVASTVAALAMIAFGVVRSRRKP